jgi:hypothetical protein
VKPAITLHQALHDRALLGAALGDFASWRTWFAVLKGAYGERLSEVERAAFASVSGGRAPPKRGKVRQLAAVVSRRAGKGRMAGALAVFESAIVDHRRHLARGEVGVYACISPTIAGPHRL